MTRFTDEIHGPNNTYTGQPSCWLNVNAPAWLGRTLYGWDFVPALLANANTWHICIHSIFGRCAIGQVDSRLTAVC